MREDFLAGPHHLRLRNMGSQHRREYSEVSLAAVPSGLDSQSQNAQYLHYGLNPEYSPTVSACDSLFTVEHTPGMLS